MAGKIVLVVDDNVMNLKLIRHILTRRGYDVREAMDAGAALDFLRHTIPAVVLTDIQMQGMDGLALTRRIKADPRTRHVPVIAVTAFAMTGDAEKATAAGCDAYVTKPIDTRSLPELVARFTGGNDTGKDGRS